MKEKDKDHNFLNNYQIFLKNSGYDKSVLSKKVESKIYSYRKTGSLEEKEGYFDAALKKNKQNFTTSLFLDKIKHLEEKNEIPPALKKTKNLFMTFSKDVLLGAALFITATVGIVAVSVVPRVALHEPQMYMTPVHEMNVSPTYMEFIKKASIYDDVTKEIAQLKDQGLLNEVDNTRGFTPLAYAIHYKNKAAIEKLVENGAVINIPSKRESKELIEQISYYNPDYQVNFKTHIEITEYLLSKGLDWRQNDYQLLKNTAAHQDWRAFWIQHFAKSDREGLDIYKNILRERINIKDVLIYDSLKELKNKNNDKTIDVTKPKAIEVIEIREVPIMEDVDSKDSKDYKALKELT